MGQNFNIKKRKTVSKRKAAIGLKSLNHTTNPAATQLDLCSFY